MAAKRMRIRNLVVWYLAMALWEPEQFSLVQASVGFCMLQIGHRRPVWSRTAENTLELQRDWASSSEMRFFSNVIVRAVRPHASGSAASSQQSVQSRPRCKSENEMCFEVEVRILVLGLLLRPLIFPWKRE